MYDSHFSLLVFNSCGEFEQVLNPGCSVYWSYKNITGRLSTRMMSLNVKGSMNVKGSSKTKDNVTINLAIAVQYRVINTQIAPDEEGEPGKPMEMDRDGLKNHGVYRAWYTLTDVQTQLRTYVEDIVRSEIPNQTLDEAYTSKERLAKPSRNL